MGVALHGNLSDFGIAEVFQLIGQQRKTGLLEISGESQTVQLAFDEGAVVWASPVGSSEFEVLGDRLVRCGLITRATLDELMRECEASARPLPSLLVAGAVVEESDLEQVSELLSRETIFEVMRWTGGSFHFTAQTINHDVSPERLLAAEQILMDGLRMLDEWRTFKDLVPGDDTVFDRVGRLDVYRQKVKAGGRQNTESYDRVFQLVDGRLDARRIIDLSRLGTFEATRILAELHQAGVIDSVDDKSPRAARRIKRSGVSMVKRLRWGLAAALPVLMLALLIGFGQQRNPVGGPLIGAPIAQRPLERVSQQFERRALHALLEARRFSSGNWPDAIRDEDRMTAMRGASLTPGSADPYYYAKRGDGIVLLAPKR